MKVTPTHKPCSTCAKWRLLGFNYFKGKCSETNAETDAQAGLHCSLYAGKADDGE